MDTEVKRRLTTEVLPFDDRFRFVALRRTLDDEVAVEHHDCARFRLILELDLR